MFKHITLLSTICLFFMCKSTPNLRQQQAASLNQHMEYVVLSSSAPVFNDTRNIRGHRKEALRLLRCLKQTALKEDIKAKLQLNHAHEGFGSPKAPSALMLLAALGATGYALYEGYTTRQINWKTITASIAAGFTGFVWARLREEAQELEEIYTLAFPNVQQ